MSVGAVADSSVFVFPPGMPQGAEPNLFSTRVFCFQVVSSKSIACQFSCGSVVTTFHVSSEMIVVTNESDLSFTCNLKTKPAAPPAFCARTAMVLRPGLKILGRIRLNRIHPVGTLADLLAVDPNGHRVVASRKQSCRLNVVGQLKGMTQKALSRRTVISFGPNPLWHGLFRQPLSFIVLPLNNRNKLATESQREQIATNHEYVHPGLVWRLGLPSRSIRRTAQEMIKKV